MRLVWKGSREPAHPELRQKRQSIGQHGCQERLRERRRGVHVLEPEPMECDRLFVLWFRCCQARGRYRVILVLCVLQVRSDLSSCLISSSYVPRLTFTSGPAQGKQLIVQATNTGGDLGQNHFDLAMPGGGVGMFNGCTNEWGAPSQGWGQQYGGISSRSACDSFPEKLKAGCYWRFDWFKNSDNPDVTFEEVTCPKAITDRSGCIRSGQTPT
jgi:hypothetical protein